MGTKEVAEEEEKRMEEVVPMGMRQVAEDEERTEGW